MEERDRLQRLQDTLSLRLVPETKRLRRTANALLIWCGAITLLAGVGVVLSAVLVWGVYR